MAPQNLSQVGAAPQVANTPIMPASQRSGETLYRFLIFGAPAAALSILASVLQFFGFFSELLAGVEAGHRSFYAGAFVIVLLLASLCLSIGWFALDQRRRREVELSRQEKLHDEGMKRIKDELDASREQLVQTTHAIEKIISKAYDLGETRWKFTEVEEIYTVQADGTTKVERSCLVEVGSKPALIWLIDLNPDGSADPIISLKQIDFQVSVSAADKGESIEYILYKDAPNEKQIAAFFLPEIVAGQRRRVNLSYTWPGFARDLIIEGHTDFEFSYRSCEPTDVANVKIELRFAISIGHVTVEQISPHVKGDSVTRSDIQGFQVFRYTNGELPMHHRTLRLKVLAEQSVKTRWAS